MQRRYAVGTGSPAVGRMPRGAGRSGWRRGRLTAALVAGALALGGGAVLVGVSPAAPAFADSVTATIPVGSDPHGVAVAANGRAYIANYGAGTVSVIDTSLNLVTATISVGNGPYGVAVAANGNAYVTNYLAGTVSVIDTSLNLGTATIAVENGPYGGPYGVAVAANGNAYVTNPDAAAVSVIDTSSNTVTATIPVGTGPYGVAVAANGNAYVTNFADDTVSVIDTSSNTVTATIPVGTGPTGVAVAPNGNAYVTNSDSNTVSVIDASLNTVTATIPVGGYPHGVAFTTTGKAYVTNSGVNTVSVIDLSSNNVAATVPVGGVFPLGVAVTANGNVYVTNAADYTVSVITPGAWPCSTMPFADVQGTTHAKNVCWMWQEGYVQSAPKFNPASPTTRAAMSTMLMRVYEKNKNWQPSARTVQNWPFTDVHTTDAQFRGIAWMYEHGYVVQSKKFHPASPVTRGAMAAMLMRINDPGYKVKTSATLRGFTDVKKSDTFYRPIAWMAEHGYATAASAYNASSSTTRGAMASFLHRVVG